MQYERSYHVRRAHPTYIERPREAIGSDLILVPAMSTLALDDDGRVLLVYEADQDAWSTPGGVLDWI